MENYNPKPLIGVLALQGDFEAHLRMLAEVGAEGRTVKLPKHLRELEIGRAHV